MSRFGKDDGPGVRRARLVLLAGSAAVAVIAALLLVRGDRVWRAAYPYLPAKVQAAPYKLREVLPGSDATPVPLPTVAGVHRAPPELGLMAAGSAAAETSATGRVAPTANLMPDGRSTPTAGAAPAARPTQTAPLAATQRLAPTAPAPEAEPTVPSAAPLELPPDVELRGLRHEYQTWNNCGPATISMALSYFGLQGGQAEAATHLKPDPNDKNVSPDELARYARDRGLRALVRVDGSDQILRSLLALGLPVVVETWFVPEPGDEMGHYRVLVGYSDADHSYVAEDSYNGSGVALDYSEFDRLWRVFNRTYVVVYPDELSGSVEAAVGGAMDDATMYAGAVERAQGELSAPGGSADGYAWFNLGGGLLGLGDSAGAVAAYDRARDLGLPWRMLWYQTGPFEAYAAEGRWADVTALAEANLRNADNLEESIYWLGRALAAQGDAEGARGAWRRALELNPLYSPAADALGADG